MVIENAYAKINFYLDVLTKRNDGFHDIFSIMHTVSLADRINITACNSLETKITLSVKGAELPCDKNNIAYLASEAYLEKSGLRSEINITIQKNIPIGAGLAGGSADAAAVLRALNKIYNRFSRAELLEIAATLGSDVPFCLVGGSAVCEGRGEIMTPIKLLPKNFVIAIGDERVNTKEAYKTLDAIYSDFKVPHGAPDIKNISADKPMLYNIFEEAAPSGVKKLKNRLSELFSDSVLMSGSGPSVFGIFADEKTAKEAAKILNDDGYTAHFAKSVIDNLI